MQTQLNISKPQLIDDPLTFQKPMHNRFGRFTFAEKFRNLIQAIIQLFKTIFCSSKRKYDSIKIEMISTGTSKLENRVKPIWADDEVGLKDTLKSGDILFVMGAGIDPRITYGQLISQTWSGAVPVTDSNRYTEHPCMYVKDENGEEWIVENAPEVTVNEGKKSRKILGEGSIKVSFKEHPLFLQLKDKDHKESKFNKKNGSDLFIKVVRPTDPKLAQEAAKVGFNLELDDY